MIQFLAQKLHPVTYKLSLRNIREIASNYHNSRNDIAPSDQMGIWKNWKSRLSNWCNVCLFIAIWQSESSLFEMYVKVFTANHLDARVHSMKRFIHSGKHFVSIVLADCSTIFLTHASFALGRNLSCRTEQQHVCKKNDQKI